MTDSSSLLLQALQLRASANRAALARRQADARALASAKAGVAAQGR